MKLYKGQHLKASGVDMSYPTWGLHIQGYSSPSPRAQAKFNKMYPHAVEDHRQALEEFEKQDAAERAEVIRKEREIQAACEHTFVPTNLDGAEVCTKCRKHTGYWRSLK